MDDYGYAGASVDKTATNGQTSLMRAAYWGHIDMAELLIDRGGPCCMNPIADVNAQWLRNERN